MIELPDGVRRFVLMTMALSLMVGAGCSVARRHCGSARCAVDCCTPGPHGVMPIPPDFEEVISPSVRGKGGLSTFAVWRVKIPVRVYRLFGGNAPAHGRHWTFAAPEGTAEQVRATYGVCKEFNDLTAIVACELPKGALVAVGPGQSVVCKDGLIFAASPANQVVVFDTKELEKCVTKVWPPAGTE
jgi:hypothetical protein